MAERKKANAARARGRGKATAKAAGQRKKTARKKTTRRRQAEEPVARDAGRARRGNDAKPRTSRRASEIPAERKNAAKKKPAGRPEKAVKEGSDKRGGDEPDAEKTAVIYIPHLGSDSPEPLEALATRIAAVLDGNDHRAEKKYVVEDSAQAIRFGRSRPKASGQAVSVIRKSDGKQSSLDLFEFDYSRSFFDRFDSSSSMVKSLRLLTTVLANITRLTGSLVRGRSTQDRGLKTAGVVLAIVLAALVGAYFFPDPRADWWWLPWAIGVAVPVDIGLLLLSKAKTSLEVVAGVGAVLMLGALVVFEKEAQGGATVLAYAAMSVGLLCLVHASLKTANPDLGDRTQLAIGFFVMSLMTMYALVLAGAAATHIWDKFDHKGTDEEVAQNLKDPLTTAAVALSAVGVTFAPKKARRQLNDFTTHLLGAVRYLSMGDGRDSEVGRLYDMIEHLSESKYKNIDIVGYSFGSVVALDALYPPKDGAPPHRVIKKVQRLVTVGCPAKTIGTFWPHMWEDRDRKSWRKGDWLNICSPHDVLSSAFKDQLAPDSKQAPPDAPVDEENRSLPPADQPVDQAAVWVTPKDPTKRSPRPCLEKVFNSGPSTKDLSVGQKFFVGGLRAHAKYWRTPYDDDRGAVAIFGTLWSGPDWRGGQTWADRFQECHDATQADDEAEDGEAEAEVAEEESEAADAAGSGEEAEVANEAEAGDVMIVGDVPPEADTDPAAG